MRAAACLFPLLLCAAATAAVEPTPPRPRANNAQLEYPASARLLGLTGEVRFSADVDASGGVKAVAVHTTPKPHMGFEEAVEQAVRKWRFDAATLDGKPVPGTYEASIVFRLRPDDERQIAVATVRLASAWNARAADQVVGEMDVSAVSDPQAGRARSVDEVRAWLAAEWGRDSKLQSASRYIWFLSPTLATTEMAREAEGGAPPTPLVGMFVKRDAGWRLLRLDSGGHHVGGAIKEPRKIRSVPPEYPVEAKMARMQGTVILEALVNAEGRVTNLRVLRGIPLLNEAAIKAVRQWIYTPTLLDGEPVPIVMTVTVDFRLR